MTLNITRLEVASLAQNVAVINGGIQTRKDIENPGNVGTNATRKDDRQSITNGKQRISEGQ